MMMMTARSVGALVSLDQISTLLRNHVRWGHSIGRGDDGDDTSIDHTQVLHAVHLERGVDDTVVSEIAHGACAGGLVDRVRDGLDGGEDLVVGLRLETWEGFADDDGGESLGEHDFADLSESPDGDLAIDGG